MTWFDCDLRFCARRFLEMLRARVHEKTVGAGGREALDACAASLGASPPRGLNTTAHRHVARPTRGTLLSHSTFVVSKCDCALVEQHSI